MIVVSAEEAFAVLQESTPALMFLDYRLPGMSGKELIELLQETNIPDFPIVVMSAFPIDYDKVIGWPNVIEFLEKPIELQDAVCEMS